MFDLSKPIAIGSDHAGFDYKVEIVKWLTEKGYKVEDKGVDENKSVDYPDYAHPVASAVENGEAAFGILNTRAFGPDCLLSQKWPNSSASTTMQT